jgi:YCII-related domain
MSKFMLLYKGPATPLETIDEDTRNKIMTGWKTWMDGVGSSLVEMGSPMGNGRSIVDDGSSAEPLELTGYSIVEAENIDQALKLVENHPFLADKTGKFSVEVFELFPSPSM